MNLPGSRDIRENSWDKSLKDGRLSASTIQPETLYRFINIEAFNSDFHFLSNFYLHLIINM